MQSGDPVRALDDCDQAVRIEPKNPLPHLIRAKILHREDDVSGAFESANTAVRLDPNSVDCHLIRGICALRRRECRVAIVDFDMVLKHDSDAVGVYCFRAKAFRLDGNLGRARSDADEAIRRDPRLGLAYYTRAQIRHVSRDYDLALSDLGVAAQVDPNLEARAAALACWIRATCTDSRKRDGQKAIDDATRVLKPTAGASVLDIHTEQAGSILMALATAEVGDFASAAKWQRRAIDLYSRQGHRGSTSSVDKGRAWLETLLTAFENHQAYRERPTDLLADFEDLREPSGKLASFTLSVAARR